jgi:SAM-dependent methyltransferase
VTLLACPVDDAGLVWEHHAMHCTADPAHVYRFEDGILRLAPPEARSGLDAQSAAYEAECAAQGWQSPDEAGFKSLPHTGLDGYGDLYWAQQAAATALLWRHLEAIRRQSGILPVGPAGEAAVIGAGMGWLAYGLDVAGYTTLAVDACAGPRYGLGVFPIARYLRVQADPLRPPLARGAFDLLVYQEGLARSGNPTEQEIALEHAIRALRPGGRIAVMDAAAPSEERSEALRALLLGAGLRLVDAPSLGQGWRAALGSLRARLSRREAGPPPVQVAQKPRQDG